MTQACEYAATGFNSYVYISGGGSGVPLILVFAVMKRKMNKRMKIKPEQVKCSA